MKEAYAETMKKKEVENRAVVLEEFQARYPEIRLTDEVINKSVPHSVVMSLENGHISFEAFLNRSIDYIKRGIAVGDGQEVMNHPDLGAIPGSSAPQPNTPSERYHEWGSEIL